MAENQGEGEEEQEGEGKMTRHAECRFCLRVPAVEFKDKEGNIAVPPIWICQAFSGVLKDGQPQLLKLEPECELPEPCPCYRPKCPHFDEEECPLLGKQVDWRAFSFGGQK